MSRTTNINNSERLQKIHRFLNDGRWHSTRDIVKSVDEMAINSAVHELRQNGAVVECKAVSIKGARRHWEYFMHAPVPMLSAT